MVHEGEGWEGRHQDRSRDVGVRGLGPLSWPHSLRSSGVRRGAFRWATGFSISGRSPSPLLP